MILKWFKHETKAHDGKFVKHIFREFGLEGEARYWRLVAFLASKYPPDKKGFYSAPLETIRETLRHRSGKDCRSFLDHLATYRPPFEDRSRVKELFIVDYSDNDCRIKYDKLAEIKDNHTSNLQATNKRLASSYQATDKQNREDKRKNKNREDAPPSPKGEHSPSAKKKPNAVVVANEILGLLRTHPQGVDIVPFASDFAKVVLRQHSRLTLGSATEFEFHQLVREALKVGA